MRSMFASTMLHLSTVGLVPTFSGDDLVMKAILYHRPHHRVPRHYAASATLCFLFHNIL